MNIAERLRGAAAIQEVLDLIGAPDGSDATIAKVICEHELSIREFLIHSMDELIQEMNAPACEILMIRRSRVSVKCYTSSHD